jgi:predicted nucleotidyltransferase
MSNSPEKAGPGGGAEFRPPVEKRTRARSAEELLRDPQVQSVVDIVRSNFSFESFYLHGSWASGRQRPSSDFDIVLLMKLPVLLAQFRRLGRLYYLKKRYRIDVKIVSTSALRRNGGSLRLKNWQAGAVLLSGRALLSTSSPISVQSYATNAFNIGVQVLRALSLTSAGVRVNEYRLRSIAHYMEEDTQNPGIPDEWQALSRIVMEQRMQNSPDGILLCLAFADYLTEIKHDLRFSPLDQLLYVVIEGLEKKRLLIRTILRRQPVQFRFAEASISLLRSATQFPPDAALVRSALSAVADHSGNKKYSDSYQGWLAVRDTLSENWDKALRVPFGLVVFKKKIVVY